MYAFDLLEIDGQDVRREKWQDRGDALTSLLANTARDGRVQQGIQLSEHLDGADGRLSSATRARFDSKTSWATGDIGASGATALKVRHPSFRFTDRKAGGWACDLPTNSN